MINTETIPVLAALLTFFSMLTFLALIGNIIVVISVCKFPRLRSQFCFHILAGLAVADVCVTLFVMPWSMVNLGLNFWPFGMFLCSVWMSFDVMCCTASILHLGLVAFDRYLAIAYPLRYAVIVNKRRIRLCMTLIWLTSAAISFVPIHIGWYRPNEDVLSQYQWTENSSLFHIDRRQERCELEVNPTYAVVSSMTSFYLPFLVCCILYGRILHIAHKQATHMRKIRVCSFRDTRVRDCHSVQDKVSPREAYPDQAKRRRHSVGTKIDPREASSEPLPSQMKNCNCDIGMTYDKAEQSGSSQNTKPLFCTSCNTLSTRMPLFRHSPRRISSTLRNELKAIRTIGLLLGFFSACWFPFFLAYLIQPFCTESCHVPRQLTTMLTWIGYANSAVNPILYGFMQRDFRTAFITLIAHPVYKYVCGWNRPQVTKPILLCNTDPQPNPGWVVIYNRQAFSDQVDLRLDNVRTEL
ncbi:7 transmembrane receptor [Paragonimus heterotremus]|uniref:7 transmembrane receptor n=1 Tax=Paragonimus heterotremus TaxID=100268 RepID=A0A8J4WLZ0_9TREM|nr:7 transmembrane receptor [Paragonimus heterotremus]